MLDKQNKSIQDFTSRMKDALSKEGIYSDEVLAYALATAAVETGGEYKPVHEYGGEKYYQRYEGRADLGNTSPGDGVKYHGRGLIQITGKDNYKKYGDRIGEDLINNPDRAMDPDVSAKIMAAYFNDAGVAKAVESGDINGARRLVNGGYNGLKEVNESFKKFSASLPKAESITQLPQDQSLLNSLGNSPVAGQSAKLQKFPTPSQVSTPTNSIMPQAYAAEVDPLSTGDRPYRTPEGGLYTTQQYGANPGFYGATGLSGHEGIDYRMDKGTQVHSPVDGQIVFVGSEKDPMFKNSYGNFVIVKTPQNEAVLLAHLDSANVNWGSTIKKGDLVGKSGSSGVKVGGKEQPHLHVSYSKNSDAALQNMSAFQKTGRFINETGGWDNPEEIFSSQYTRNIVDPTSVIASSKPEKIIEATNSARTSSPTKNQIGSFIKRTVQGMAQKAMGFVPQAQAQVQTPRYQPPSQQSRDVVGLTPGMQAPIMSTAPKVNLPAYLDLRQLSTVNQAKLATPNFNVGQAPQNQTLQQRQFTPGFSNPVAGITKTYADIVKNAFQSREEQPQLQQSDYSNQQSSQKNNSANQIALIKAQQLKQQAQKQSSTSGGGYSSSGSSSGSFSGNSSGGGYRTPSSSSSYVVKRGDTPSQIAQRTLGDASRWKEIYSGDPRKMQIGTKLNIPSPSRAR